MSSRHLDDDTALCLAAIALAGKLDVTPTQRELLKAVARCEVVRDIARQARLPLGLVKRELEALIERGLVSLRDDSEPPSVPVFDSRPASDSSRGPHRERQDSGVMPKSERRSRVRVAGPDSEAARALVQRAATADGDVVGSVGEAPGDPSRELDDEDSDWLLESQVDAAFERLGARTVASADSAPPPSPHTVPSPNVSGEVRASLPSPLPPGPLDDAAKSSPPPPYSMFKGLKPGADEQEQLIAKAAGDGGGQGEAAAIPRVRVPLPSEIGKAEGGELAEHTIPLVAVVRQPTIKLGGESKGPPGMARGVETEITNTARRIPSDPGRSPTTERGVGQGAGAPQSPRPRTNPAFPGAPVQLPPMRAPAVPSELRDAAGFSSTLMGVMAPSEAERAQRTSDVVPSGREDASGEAGVKRRGSGTLVGVFAPAEARVGASQPMNDATPPSAALESQPPSSDQLEHYEVLECLAKGGNGVVYKVRDPQAPSGEYLALKVLRQDLHSDPSAVTSLIHEAQLSSVLHHPNLIELEYYGRQRGEPFLLMHYIEGLSMSELLHHPVPLPLDVGLIIIQDALEVLDYVHNVRLPEVTNGLVHCDVSPTNLLVGTDGVTRLIDFGTAREQGQFVADAQVRCKPRYSSPELMAGDAVDATCDIFSMGAVLFQVLSKQPAFSADPARRKAESLVPNPSMLNRRAPTHFDPICLRALDPDPTKRYQSAREMLAAVDDAVERSSIELRRQRVNFWVRRVIQSRHGAVEFDINELQDLLDDKRAPARNTRRRDENLERERRFSTPPPPPPTQPVERRSVYGNLEPVAPIEASDAAMRQQVVALRRTLWITGLALGTAIVILLFALLRPQAFRTWFLMQEPAVHEFVPAEGELPAQRPSPPTPMTTAPTLETALEPAGSGAPLPSLVPEEDTAEMPAPDFVPSP